MVLLLFVVVGMDADTKGGDDGCRDNVALTFLFGINVMTGS
jgi:hypothetical protein